MNEINMRKSRQTWDGSSGERLLEKITYELRPNAKMQGCEELRGWGRPFLGRINCRVKGPEDGNNWGELGGREAAGGA